MTLRKEKVRIDIQQKEEINGEENKVEKNGKMVLAIGAKLRQTMDRLGGWLVNW